MDRAIIDRAARNGNGITNKRANVRMIVELMRRSGGGGKKLS
jgi:hypothetical protein